MCIRDSTDREGEVILKKYSMIGDIGQFAKQYADALSQTTGYLVMVTDRDMVIAASSGVKKDMVGKHISRELEKAALDRKIILTDSSKKEYCRVADDMEGDYIEAIAPIDVYKRQKMYCEKITDMLRNI